VNIKPFPIGMAAKETESTSTCTHRGDFPLQMKDGSILYTPVFYNKYASDTILSPEAICASSNGILKRWMQCGSSDGQNGCVAFFDSSGAEVLSLALHKRNGLYYTPIDSVAVDTGRPQPSRISDFTVYYHTPDGVEDDNVSIDLDTASLYSPYDCCEEESISSVTIAPVPPPFLPSGSPTISHSSQPVPSPNIATPAPDVASDYIPKSKQIEADLWQARFGHCDEWQMKVLPMSVDGTPSKFCPHPFASYDWYNQARIRKRPATRGKHPSRATGKEQRIYMDFGFLRASQADYSRPDKTKERVVTSFDGFNSYLLIVDEFTKYVWVYLCVSKEPPIELINLHLDKFNTNDEYIRCDQGGELAACDEFMLPR